MYDELDYDWIGKIDINHFIQNFKGIEPIHAKIILYTLNDKQLRIPFRGGNEDYYILKFINFEGAVKAKYPNISDKDIKIAYNYRKANEDKILDYLLKVEYNIRLEKEEQRIIRLEKNMEATRKFGKKYVIKMLDKRVEEALKMKRKLSKKQFILKTHEDKINQFDLKNVADTLYEEAYNKYLERWSKELITTKPLTISTPKKVNKQQITPKDIEMMQNHFNEMTPVEVYEAVSKIENIIENNVLNTKKVDIKQFIGMLYRFKGSFHNKILLKHPDEFEFGGKTFSEWYEIYSSKYKEMNPPKRKIISQKHKNKTKILNYPYKSKIDSYNKLHQNNVKLHDTTIDPQIPKNMFIPEFSELRHTWQVDVAFATDPKYDKKYLQHYLTCINVNTKYGIFIPIKNKSVSELIKGIDKLRNIRPVNKIMGDGDFDSTELLNYYKTHKIQHYVSTSKYTNHNKSVDVLIKNVRNALGLNPYNFADNDLIQQTLKYYNNTPHLAFKHIKPRFGAIWTPMEVETYVDLELLHVNNCMKKRDEIRQIRRNNGLMDYKPDNILLIHRDLSKTSEMFNKRRRRFDDIGRFIKYQNGNVLAELFDKRIIEVPIYHTHKIANNYNSLLSDYKEIFSI